MPEQDAAQRGHNFLEVNLGLPAECAQQESMRCIECKDPKCISTCPVGVKVREFLDLVLEGDYLAAAAKIREDNALPAITGRVCPQEDQCEGGCLLGNKGAPLAIGYLERFVADYEQQTGQLGIPPIAPPTGKKVAIVGSGPAGLSCAGDLIQKGHRVRVFEALHEIGGVLVYGIPEFRLPKTIVRQEVDNLRRMGVEFETNVVVGKTVTIDELMKGEGYDAVFICTGAGLPQFLNVPGEHLNGVYSANEFLTRVNLMRAYKFPEYDEPVYDCRDKDVVVFGGGNTAMDAVRTSLRLGARTASIFYRRTEKEMPARKEEVHHAKDEGINFQFLVNPVELHRRREGLAESHEVHPHGTGRARRLRTPPPDSDPRLRVRDPGLGGHRRRGNDRQPADPVDHAGPEDQQVALHRHRPGHHAHLEAGRLRRRRHRNRRRNRHSGHGRRTPGSQINPRLPEHRRVGDSQARRGHAVTLKLGAPFKRMFEWGLFANSIMPGAGCPTFA